MNCCDAHVNGKVTGSWIPACAGMTDGIDGCNVEKTLNKILRDLGVLRGS